jgi:glutamine synthetase
MGLPLLSLEIELGPSQVEAVFAPTDALRAADNMVRFRNGVRQALARAGYWASFMCRPPFEHIMSSGWHLHQSLIDLHSGANLFVRAAAASGSSALDAENTLSTMGAQYLAGLLDHAAGALVFCTPTANGYGRFRPLALAPQAAVWGRDNRGAMLRVIGQAQDSGTRIENRIGEPAANPYLYMASQIHAGLDGIARGLKPPAATESPYGQGNTLLPTDLGQALAALQADTHLVNAFGPGFVALLSGIKQLEWQRFQQADDKMAFQRHEYFSRICGAVGYTFSVALEQKVQSGRDARLVCVNGSHTVFQNAQGHCPHLGGFQQAILALDADQGHQLAGDFDFGKVRQTAQRNHHAAVQPVQQIALDIQQIRRGVGVRARVGIHIKACH